MYGSDYYNGATAAPKPLTPEQEVAAVDAYLAEIARELTIRGEDPTTAIARAVLDEFRPYFKPKATRGEPTVGYINADRIIPVRTMADRVLEDIRERETVAGYGPDPRTLLAERLMKLGISSVEAQAIAATRIRRLPDGRVAALDASGRTAFVNGELKGITNPSDEMLATMRDPSRALEYVTRAILAERQRAENPPATVDHRRKVVSAF